MGYWYEIYDMVRKFIFTSVLVMAGRGDVPQIFAACCLAFCAFAIQMHVKPYKRPEDNLLRACSEAQLCLTLFGSLVLKLDAANVAAGDGGDEAGFDVAMTAVTLMVFPLPAAIIIGRPALRNIQHFLSTSTDSVPEASKSGRSSTPVTEIKTADLLPVVGDEGGGNHADAEDADLESKDELQDSNVSARKGTERRKADWKAVQRGGSLKWTKKYRLNPSDLSSCAGSSGGDTRAGSSRGSNRSGSSAKESVRRAPRASSLDPHRK